MLANYETFTDSERKAAIIALLDIQVQVMGDIRRRDDYAIDAIEELIRKLES